MIYDFAGKIKRVKNENAFDSEWLNENVKNLFEQVTTPPEKISVLALSSSGKSNEILIKAQFSISSLSQFHDGELNAAIEIFQSCLEETALIIDGEVSEDEGFYNNSKIFSKLYL